MNIDNSILSIDSKRGKIGRNTAKSRLYNWKKQGKLSHVRRGIYIPADVKDKFRIACYAVPDACLAYHSALEYYGLQTQEFNRLYVHSSSVFRDFTFENVTYQHKPLKFIYKPLIDASDKRFPVVVTSISQTIIDCLYNIGLAGGLEELMLALAEVKSEDIQEHELLKCLELYDIKSLYQRTGFVLSFFEKQLGLSSGFFDICKSKSGNNVSYLIQPYFCDTFHKEWNICAPYDISSEIKKGIYYE